MSIIPPSKFDKEPAIGVSYRRPRALVTFITDEITYLNADDVVSVRTSKSLSSPFGTFEIVLKANAFYEKEPVEAQNKQGLLAADWFLSLPPMTIVWIAFGEEHELETLVSDLPQNESYQKTAKRAITMIGYVETVSLNSQMTPNGPQRVVVVQGADLAKIFTLDSTYHFQNNAKNLYDKAVNAGFDYVGHKIKGTETYGFTDAEAKAFFARISAVDEKGQLNFRAQAINGKFIVDPASALKHIVNAAPNFQVRFADGKNLLNYMQRLVLLSSGTPAMDIVVDMDPLIKQMRLFYQHWLSHTGPLWGLFMRFFPRPQVEFFMDTVGLEYHTIIRRPPFYRPGLFKNAEDVLETFVKRVYNQFKNSGKAKLTPLFPDTDQFTGTPLRVVQVADADKRYHVIDAQDIISLNVSKTEQEVVNVYQAITDTGFQGSSPVSQFTHPMLADLPSIKRFGMRVLQFRSPWAGMEGLPEPDDEAEEVDRSNANFYAVAQRETVYAYYYFRDNPAMMSGTVLIRGQATIRVGDRIVFSDLSRPQIAYVESVSNTFIMGSPYVTQITFSRMQPLYMTDVENGRLVDYDSEDVVVEQLPTVTVSEAKAENNQTSTTSTTESFIRSNPLYRDFLRN